MVAANQSGQPDITVEPRGSIHLGGKSAEIYWFGRAHTDGDVVVLFPAASRARGRRHVHGRRGHAAARRLHRAAAAPKNGPRRSTKVLALDFDTVIPGHGSVVKKADMQAFRASTQRLTELVTGLVRQNKSSAEIEAAMRSEFGWQDFHVQMALDGLINEMR